MVGVSVSRLWLSWPLAVSGGHEGPFYPQASGGKKGLMRNNDLPEECLSEAIFKITYQGFIWKVEWRGRKVVEGMDFCLNLSWMLKQPLLWMKWCLDGNRIENQYKSRPVLSFLSHFSFLFYPSVNLNVCPLLFPCLFTMILSLYFHINLTNVQMFIHLIVYYTLSMKSFKAVL